MRQIQPLSSESGTSRTVKTGFCRHRSGKCLETFSGKILWKAFAFQVNVFKPFQLNDFQINVFSGKYLHTLLSCSSFFFFFITLGLELSETKVYKP